MTARSDITAAVLVVAAVVASGCGSRTQEVISSPARLTDVRCVAVLPFENITQVPASGSVVAETISDLLIEKGRFNILEPLETRRILDALGLGAGPVTDSNQAKQYGEALGVEAILTGMVTDLPTVHDLRVNDERPISFTAKLIDTASGKILWATSVSQQNVPVVLNLPESRARLARSAVREGLQSMLRASSYMPIPDQQICWRPFEAPSEDVVTAIGKTRVDDKYTVYIARGGETMVQLAQLFLINGDKTRILSDANPGFSARQLLRRGQKIRVPKWIDYTTNEGDSLSSIANTELGHPAFATLLFASNQNVFSTATPEQKADEVGVLIDARQRWTLFDVAGSVDDMFVVVNGVPWLFPRVSVSLRWLLYGRKLAMRGDKPAEETFFEVEIEEPDFAKNWRLEMRDARDVVVLDFSNDGPPPSVIEWDGLLDRAQTLQPGKTYRYQLTVEYQDGSIVKSPVETFGTGVRATPVAVTATAKTGERVIEVRGGRFAARFSTGEVSGKVPVELVTDTGASGSGHFFIPSVTILRPTKAEMLRVGVSNETYTFPKVPIVDGQIDLNTLDRVDITFTLTGRTEPENEIVIDGQELQVAPNGLFRTKLHLKRGKNLFSILARAPSGSQSFVEEQIFLRTRGAGAEPWQFSSATFEDSAIKARDPLERGLRLRLPTIRVPIGAGDTLNEAMFSSGDDEEEAP